MATRRSAEGWTAGGCRSGRGADERELARGDEWGGGGRLEVVEPELELSGKSAVGDSDDHGRLSPGEAVADGASGPSSLDSQPDCFGFPGGAPNAENRVTTLVGD